MRTKCIGFAAGLLSGLVTIPAPADDIDIYTGRGGRSSGPVRIMLSLDLRQGSAGPACDDAGSASCSAGLGERLYAQLDLFGLIKAQYANAQATGFFGHNGGDEFATKRKLLKRADICLDCAANYECLLLIGQASRESGRVARRMLTKYGLNFAPLREHVEIRF